MGHVHLSNINCSFTLFWNLPERDGRGHVALLVRKLDRASVRALRVPRGASPAPRATRGVRGAQQIDTRDGLQDQVQVRFQRWA